MKKLITFCIFLTCLLMNNSNAQIESIQIHDTTLQCSNEKFIYSWFQIGSQDDNFSVQINWGDGSSDNTTLQTYYANQYYNLDFSHIYVNPGIYTVELSALSSVSGNTIVSNIVQYTVNEEGHCGYLEPYTYTSNNCWMGPQYFLNAFYELIGFDGTINSFSGNLENVDINNVPYTLRIKDDWLLQNNLTYTGSPIIIQSFDNYGNAIFNGASSFQVTSLSTSTNPDFYFVNAYGFGFSPLQLMTVHFSVGDFSCNLNSNAQIQLTFPNFLVPNTDNLTNANIVGNVIYFEHNLSNFWFSINFFLPGTTPVGSNLDFNIQVNDMSGLETFITNNNLSFSAMVFNSFDPNNKLVNKAENINPTEQEELIYTINFQNEGNADALKVVVKDTLSDNLDLSTFEVIRTKHNVVTSMNPTTREVKFTFNDIYLAPKDLDEEGSKGYIVYKIKEKVNLPINSEINNTAYIYFDFNPAIITNTTLNRNTLLSVNEIAKNTGLTLYPNPVNDKLQIKSTEEVKSIAIYTTNGVKVLETNQAKSILDVSTLINGVYFVEVLTDSSIIKEKIVIQD